jgi:hypothetical protein
VPFEQRAGARRHGLVDHAAFVLDGAHAPPRGLGVRLYQPTRRVHLVRAGGEGGVEDRDLPRMNRARPDEAQPPGAARELAERRLVPVAGDGAGQAVRRDAGGARGDDDRLRRRGEQVGRRRCADGGGEVLPAEGDAEQAGARCGDRAGREEPLGRLDHCQQPDGAHRQPGVALVLADHLVDDAYLLGGGHLGQRERPNTGPDRRR